MKAACVHCGGPVLTEKEILQRTCASCRRYGLVHGEWPKRTAIQRIEEEERERRNNIPEILLGLDVAENLRKQ